MLSRLSTYLGFPNTPIDHGLVVSVYLSASSGEILMVGPPSGNAQEYASFLAKWSKCVGNPVSVQWSPESDGAAARLRWGHGTFGIEHGEQAVPVGNLVQSLRQNRWDAKVALRYVLHAVPPGARTPEDSTRTYASFDVSNVEANFVARPTVTLPTGIGLLFWVFVGFVPVVTSLGFLAAGIVASRKNLPLPMRRRYYSKLVRYTSTGGVGIHAPFAFYLIYSGALKPIADLWFGSTTLSTVMIPFLILPMVVLAPAAKAMSGLEKKLFGATEEEKSKLPAPMPVAPEALARRARFRQATSVVRYVGIATLLASQAFLNQKVAWRPAPIVFGLVLLFLAESIVRPFLKAKPGDYAEKYRDAGLDAEARDLAALMGTEVQLVQVDRSPAGVLYPNARIDRKGNVTVTARAMQILEPAERRFLLAHELAHHKLGHVKTRLLKVTIPLLACSLPMFYVFLMLFGAPRVFAPGVGFGLAVLGSFYSLLFGQKIRKRHELEADALAVQTTGDLSAAENTLSKLALGSPMPHMHELDELASHPALSRRIENLRAAIS
ncbi:peptidase M48 Ste24p [Fimbriimonas ginsengisoli Gsoil 348]|uniref:Peptidase M48 Ste24p n=1 Tax=Fimbriimonas ginsengisoli Gsoil 348 TaxID=661478 RepID=A0A068NYA0_FIMGI|nr:peptidase M48 Ste24p [Fimbriimonas ginsengisoli Gsoil 348]